MSPNRNELVSVIVPVYNTEAYLEQCVKSILQQKYQAIEVIIVDDGSEEKTSKLCDRLAETDSRIVVVHKENGGISSARNMGIKVSKGQWLFFVDSDDYLRQNAISALFEALEEAGKKNEELDFIQGSFIVENCRTKKTRKAIRFNPRAIYNRRTLEGEDYLLKLGFEMTYPWNSLISKKFISKHNIVFHEDLKTHEDLLFIVRMLTSHCHAQYVDSEGYVYRWGRPDSLTTGSQDNMKNQRVLKSLMLCSACLKSQVNTNNRRVNKMIDTQINSNLTGCLNGIHKFGGDISLLTYMKQLNDSIPFSSQAGPIRNLLALIYNISPMAAYKFRRLMSKIIK